MKIYVGNLSFQTSDDTLRSLFTSHGSVDEVAVVTDRDTGRPRGFAFVSMTNDNEAQKAIDAINGTELDSRTLNVSQARERTSGGGSRGRW